MAQRLFTAQPAVMSSGWRYGQLPQHAANTTEVRPLRQSLTGAEDLRFEENNLHVFVDVEATAENDAFFQRFKEDLKRRFNQIDIWIISYEIRST